MHTQRTLNRIFGTTLLAIMVSMAGCASTTPTFAPPTTVMAAAAQAPELSTFYTLVQQAGLTASLEVAGPITVFAPTNDAFKAVPADKLDKLSKDPVLLKSVLTYHVIPGSLKSADITANTSVTTLNGTKLAISKAGDFVTVDDGMVTQADVMTGNGVLHLVDSVLMPAVKK